jgi:predicted RNA-binding protein with TRAM domain
LQAGPNGNINNPQGRSFKRGVGLMDGIGRPVEEGREYEVTIDAKGAKGDGIAHLEGFVIFVQNAEVGEKVKVKITVVKRTFAIGEKV